MKTRLIKNDCESVTKHGRASITCQDGRALLARMGEHYLPGLDFLDLIKMPHFQ